MDLHMVHFSNLFYDIHGSSNPEERALEIANSIMPASALEFKEVKAQMKKENEKLEELLDEIKRLPKDRARIPRSKHQIDEFDFEWLFRMGSVSPVEYYLYEPDVNIRGYKTYEFSKQDYFYWFFSNLDPHISIVEEYMKDSSRLPKTFMKHCKKEPIATLLLLPSVKKDHKMIIFFGERFHASFANVDAYTGLHYAYEFFKKKY